jgi:hypothetical protein
MKTSINSAFNLRQLPTQQREWWILMGGKRIGSIRQIGQSFGWRDRFGGHWFATQQEAIEARIRAWRVARRAALALELLSRGAS